MNVRRVTAAAAVPCLCLLAFEAAAQGPRAPRPIVSAGFDLREVVPQPSNLRSSQRLGEIREPNPATSNGMLGSWDMAPNARFGLGRWRVGEIARARTHTENVRSDLMARENRAVAGAGVHITFD